ncbi:MAG: hypothetical protein HZA93_22580 [Verrucomicrobia bacterium]|nr:hypothetical protein [Verrucomicrobiota bacterium]
MNSLPLIVLGAVFALGGLLLGWLTFRKPAPEENAKKGPVKKSELRAKEQEQKDATKLRIGAGILVAFGVVLMIIA